MMKIKTFKTLNKERFQPDITYLNMKLKDARIEVRKKQREISVAMRILPRNINEINNILKYRKCNENQLKDLTENEKILLKNVNKISKQIDILVKSKAARIIAVHRVLTNKGYRSPGVTVREHPTTNEEYVEIVEWLKKTMNKPNKYTTSPLDRIYLLKKVKKFPNVKKPNKLLGDTYSREKQLRPISIPSIKDRCLQAAYYIGYIVYSEYIADPNSYAFRPGRSPAWAAASLAITLRSNGAPTWALEVDIAKCYDNIDHEFIKKHTPFIPEIIIDKWLKQGYILRKYENLGVFETKSGIPQGGIISPTICNTVLDGAEDFIRKNLWLFIKKTGISAKEAGYSYFRGKQEEALFKLFRYADDIVITAKSLLIANLCREYLSEFLKIRGLHLSSDKTKMTDLSGNKAYFEFIGYSFVKKYAKTENKTKWFIDIPTKSIESIKERLNTLCHSKCSIEKLFYEFSTILRSWVGYYATCNISRHLQILNIWVYKIFYYALERRIRYTKEIRNKHFEKRKMSNGKRKKIGKLGRKEINHLIHTKYIKTITYHQHYKMKWYQTIIGKGKRRRNYLLFSPRIFKIIGQTTKSLTMQHLDYFSSDINKIVKINLNYKYGTKAKVLKKNFKKYNEVLTCPCCLESFAILGKYDFHHVTPVEFGGDSKDSNLIPICKPCHKGISTAVAKRSLNDIEDYMNRELLKIPEKYLDQFE